VASTKNPVQQALDRALDTFKDGRIYEAIGICRDLLAKNADLVGALGLLGGILGHAGQIDEAIAFLERAVALEANVANWHLNLCVMYRGKNLLDKALAAGTEAVRYSPDTAAHRLELALTHVVRGERGEAERLFREAMVRDPENAAPHMGLGEVLLAQGDYIPGWREYAWRNKLEQARGTLPPMIAAPWNGMRMPNGTLLLVADQGFGDMIQFARYIPMAKERVANLVVGWGPEVTALLGEHPDITACFPSWDAVPPHDVYTLLSSLPEIFQTDIDTIPLPIPYIHPKADKVATWRAKLDAALPDGRIRVGIAWSGRSTHPNNFRRSVRLETLAPILAVPGIDFVTLQKPFPEEDRAFAGTLSNLLDISAELESFNDTSAVMTALDLVIAVDTAIVHLAGASGRTAWVLVPEPADWRWLLDREDSVWYPTLRLFRQTAPAEWAPVVQRMARELDAFRTSLEPQQRSVA
jgi:ADP-heptose:LPS heptosyltransferase